MATAETICKSNHSVNLEEQQGLRETRRSEESRAIEAMSL